MKIIPLISVLILFASIPKTLACNCSDYDEETIKELFEVADYVIIGKPTKTIHFDRKMQQLLNLDSMGADVLFKVDSVFKGNIAKGQLIYVVQFAGSCTQTFYFGDSYLILGVEIKKFKKGKDYNKSASGEKPLPPPPPSYPINGAMELYSDRQIIKFLNKQSSRYTTITTDMCLSARNDEKLYDILKNHIGKHKNGAHGYFGLKCATDSGETVPGILV